MTFGGWLLLAHAFSASLMCGLIWFVQVVHYPMFARVPAEAFPRYEREHQTRTTLVVLPLMLVELVSAALILVVLPGGVPMWAAAVGLGMLLGIWLSTFGLQVPQHRRLERGLDEAVVRALVAGNWFRTVLWTARAALALLMVGGLL